MNFSMTEYFLSKDPTITGFSIGVIVANRLAMICDKACSRLSSGRWRDGCELVENLELSERQETPKGSSTVSYFARKSEGFAHVLSTTFVRVRKKGSRTKTRNPLILLVGRRGLEP